MCEACMHAAFLLVLMKHMCTKKKQSMDTDADTDTETTSSYRFRGEHYVASFKAQQYFSTLAYARELPDIRVMPEPIS